MIRSMSNAQIEAAEVARHGVGFDKEPWVCIDCTDIRFSDDAIDDVRRFHDVVFAPRPECIPSPDPLPLLIYVTGDVWLRAASLNGQEGGHEVRYSPRPWGSFIPDPEFVRSEVNPIFVSFRESNVTDPNKWLEFIRVDRELESWSGDQVAEAIKVLIRLRDVMEALQ